MNNISSAILIYCSLYLYICTLVVDLKVVKHLSSDNMEQLYYYSLHMVSKSDMVDTW